jgi:DNA-binding NtrC family response regulator
MTRDSQVMFVDDEEGVRVSWERYFQGRGLKTTTAPDGATAIDRLSQHPVDVVVSDMRMPGKNGLELLEWLHIRQPDTRFIMLTGYGDRRLEWEARQLGAVEYLEKLLGAVRVPPWRRRPRGCARSRRPSGTGCCGCLRRNAPARPW